MLLSLSANAKLVVAWVLILGCFSFGWYMHGVFYDAAKASELEAAQKLAAEKNKERNDIATEYEGYRSRSQAKINAINQKWSSYAKHLPDCPLSAESIGMLKDDSIPYSPPPR